MERSALALLACPTCRSSLILQVGSNDPIETGSLSCGRCQAKYPIKQGIPHFIQLQELTGFNQRFARMYNRFSWAYRSFSKIAFAFIGLSEERGRREILDRIEPRSERVLEVSIGPGVNLPYLVQRTDIREIHGLDISLGQLNRCRSYIRRKGWPVELFLGNAEALPFQDKAFDAVFHIGGINFFNDKKKAIDEMIRVAKPGTRILISDENEKGARGYDKTIPGFRQAFEGGRQAITAPVDLIPADMQEVHVFNVWKDWFYCLEFRKPS